MYLSDIFPLIAKMKIGWFYVLFIGFFSSEIHFSLAPCEDYLSHNITSKPVGVYHYLRALLDN